MCCVRVRVLVCSVLRSLIPTAAGERQDRVHHRRPARLQPQVLRPQRLHHPHARRPVRSPSLTAVANPPSHRYTEKCVEVTVDVVPDSTTDVKCKYAVLNAVRTSFPQITFYPEYFSCSVAGTVRFTKSGYSDRCVLTPATEGDPVCARSQGCHQRRR